MPRIVFKGLRKTFLEEQLEGYQKSTADGTKDDFVNDVIRRFLKRFPLELPLDKEPSQEYLAAVDDSQPDPEIEHPVARPGNGFQKQYEEECQKYKALLSLLETRKEQIARWLRYHHAKKHGLQKELDVTDPSTIFASKLLGVALDKPRKISAFLLYQRDNAELLTNLYNAAKQGLLASNAQDSASPSDNSTPGKPSENAAPADSDTVSAGGPSTTTTKKASARKTATTKVKAPSKPLTGKSKKSRNGPGRVNIGSRGTIAQDLWSKEPEDVREEYEARAVKEHEEAVEEWTETLNSPPSSAPEDLQACIDQIASLIQPALDTVTKYTGMKATFIMGGPEPADGGEVNVISLHSGSIRGPVKMNFAQSKRIAYQTLIVPAFAAFLNKCYTQEDIQRAALPKTKSALAYLSENEVSYCDSNGISKAVSSTSSTSSPTPAAPSASSPTPTSPSTSPSSTPVAPSTSSPTPTSPSTSPSSAPSLSSTSQCSPRPDMTPASAHSSTAGASSVPNSSSEERSPPVRSDKGSEAMESGGSAEDMDCHNAPSSDGVQSSGVVMRSPSFPPPPSSPLFTPPCSPTSRSRLHYAQTTPTPTLSKASTPPPPPLAHSNAARNQAQSNSSPLPPNPRIGPPKRKKGNQLSKPAALSDVAANSSISTRSVLGDLNPQLPDVTPLDASTRKRPSEGVPPPDKPSKRRREAVKENVGDVGSGNMAGDVPPRKSTPNTKDGEPGSQRESNGSSRERKRKRAVVDETAAAGEVDSGAGEGGVEVMSTRSLKGKRVSEDGSSRPKRYKAALSMANSSVSSNDVPPPTNPSFPSFSTAPSTQGRSTATQCSYATALSSPPSPLSYEATSTPSLAHLVRDVPEDCDQSIAAALKLLTSSSLGVKFDALIAIWLHFESAHDYKGSTKRISTAQRPPIIGDWIQRARSSTFAPFFDVEEFGIHFWSWWSNLQPTWRKITANTTAREVNGEWDALDKPGGNGWPSIIAALFFWGRRLGEARVEGGSWDIAVDDVNWVLSELRRHHAA